jgi:hypothetical protein
MKSKIKKYFLSLMFDSQNRKIIKKKDIGIPKNILDNYQELQFCSFGKKNKDKIFYVIQRKIGGGLFSNLLYVLNHLIISEKFHFVPVIDMENFEGFYNEKSKVNKTLNSWEYYFEQPANFSLEEVYKSKNVIITSNKTFKNYKFRAKTKHIEIKKVFRKYIKFKKNILIEVENIIQNLNINKTNTIGLHWRGTDHKFLPNHPQPPSRKQIFERVSNLVKNSKSKKIFVVTEDPDYLKILKKKYNNQILYLNSFRSTKSSDFSNFARKNHRYRVGKESIIETLILSRLNYLICSESNISDFVKFMSLNKKFIINRISNGRNSKNPLISYLRWKLRSTLPSFLGGY